MTPLETTIAKIMAQPADDIAKAKCCALMIGYDNRWSSAGYVSLSAEEPFQLPVVNPETGAQSKSFTQVGVFDGMVEYDGRTYCREGKTTSDDIADPNSTYWRRLAIDSQVSGYALANWQAGRKIDGTLYDVVRKPTIRPKKLAQKERVAITSLGTYCHLKVSDETQRAIVAGMETENAELYGLRLQADVLAEPQKYFARRIIPRLDGEILEWAGDLWDLTQDLLATRRRNRWPKTSAACMNFGRPCEYLGICSGHDSPDSDKWQKRQSAKERHGIDSPLETLSHSALTCFQSCKKKYFHRYVLGIERVDEEESEALMFGSLWHVAMETWWNCFSPLTSEVKNGDSSQHPANGVGSDDCEAQPCGLNQDWP